jgi:glycosyltransferase involved in cell wall biosynthesis
MSGIFLEAAAEAKARYGARINLHRGSQHILAQDEILARIPGAARPSALAIERELAGYELADSINIASEHVARSFERDPAAHAKLVLNPYGTDLDAFPMTPRPAVEADVTFVLAGLWCLQKGCDLLEAAVRRTPNVRVLHVGSIGDHPFPEGDGRFRHLDKVDQHALAGVYAQAHAFVLPSRQDGFGMVIPQALASGLPAICSDHTGGPELRYTPALDDRIVVVPTEDVDALAAAMATVRDRLRAGPAFAELTEADRETLTWAAYGRRYVEVLVDALDDGAAA